MVRPKRNSNKKRVTVDLSYPAGVSVNAGIRKGRFQGQPMTDTMPIIIDLAEEVTRLGTGAFIWCVDLACSSRQLRSCLLSMPLLGITLHDCVYIDIAPPFGCQTSSMACGRLSDE